MTKASMLYIAILATQIISVPAGIGKSLNAICKLEIDGAVVMNSKCLFEVDRDDPSKRGRNRDFFSDERLLVVCPDGRPASESNCAGYQQTVKRKGIFGYLFREGATASVCWNKGISRKADPCYRDLKREGACWVSRLAGGPDLQPHSVRFCAWKP
jgi:hypothetical protein